MNEDWHGFGAGTSFWSCGKVIAELNRHWLSPAVKMSIIRKGDTERQATLRDEMIRRKKRARSSNYFLKISSIVKPQMKLLDVGCGTAHIIEDLSKQQESAVFVGLDVSPAMLRIAKMNTMGSSSVLLVEGDGERLPFSECSFDILITRLAEHSLQEAYRVLKKGGFFFEYRLGPEASKEIAEFFPARIEKESFFLPTNLEEWKEEVSQRVTDAGFLVENIDDHKEREYHSSKEELMNLIEMVPLVRNFDRKKDREIVGTLARKYGGKKGIQTTWHYYILTARRC